MIIYLSDDTFPLCGYTITDSSKRPPHVDPPPDDTVADRPAPAEPSPPSDCDAGHLTSLEKTVDRLLTMLIAKGIITPDQADTIATGIPK
jgi:hypothetical protein